MRLDITLDGGPGYEPGSDIHGEALWDLPHAARRVSLRLFWFTQGKGQEDLEVVHRLELATGALQARVPFRLTLPAQPYSCSGQLVSVRWALELVADDEGEVHRRDLVIAPGGREVRIDGDPG